MAAENELHRVESDANISPDHDDIAEVNINALGELRKLMADTQLVEDVIHGYIVPNHDCHMNEYLAPPDKRLAFLTKFSGSTGTAIVTNRLACLWTDPRYYLQATYELDEEWTLMKMGLPGHLNEAEWLCANLIRGSKVGCDPHVMPYPLWLAMRAELEKFQIKLIPVTNNLIDVIWGSLKPTLAKGNIYHHNDKFTGMLARDKIAEVQDKMKEKATQLLIVTALDDIAWILNLRGNDIKFNPVFFAFLVLTRKKLHLFINQEKVHLTVRNHFNRESLSVELHPYDNVYTFLKLMTETDRMKIKKVWIPSTTNYFIYNMIPAEKRFCEGSPIAEMKSIKNEIQADCMETAHIKDGVAISRFLYWLEKEIDGESSISETLAVERLERLRRMEESYIGPSCETISASGPHTGITNYNPVPDTNLMLSSTQLYLFEAGSQYLDGTTDLTRTVHFGNPTEFEKECFTRIFKGLVALSTCIFPNKTKGNVIDVLARKALWEVGLDYGHGSGHGIGMHLCVHEGPIGISWRPYPDDPGLQEGMFISVEPSYYCPEFGIRLENILRVIPCKTPNNFQDKGFLTFKNVTMCPIQLKMLELTLLTKEEVTYLNEFHDNIKTTMVPVLKKRALPNIVEWVIKNTTPVEIKAAAQPPPPAPSASAIPASTIG